MPIEDADKIVAATLAAGYASKDLTAVNPADYVRLYHAMLEELRAADKASEFSKKLDELARKAPTSNDND